ncbi:microtubule associated protein-domain-containing protein [Corynascus novoguineensis]|uniref:Microtubule associated protein-domain-containing protein n=1 Tax=Corynascus novoguineensis TaxID=1126955 RepID=A0AAN7D404_9PEZI|nr:microtubule associated protein-domain-containing protein [Corynascus novoguineensis]
MDTSFLAQQVNTIIGQLHGLFDEIGVPNHDRDAREEELFAALSDALNNQVRLVTEEKNEMIEEAQKMITQIRQMEASLDDSKPRRDSGGDLKITYPLTRCLQVLKEKHIQVSRLHRERYEQVKKLVQALESYSLHLEPTFVELELPPTGPNQSIPPSFDLSPAYVDKLDAEFTRVYEEYTRRVATVKAIAEDIIQLWAELGTPQAQTDGAIVKYYRDAPEQLGLHEEDLARLSSKKDKLLEEKKNREKRLKDLKCAVEALWEKLGVEERERKAFLNSNRGCGIRQINEFEDELARLNELKRQNLHLFVEDARCRLQELWDALYLSEDEMLEFTPAFSDVYSDALLEAHEREITRLEILQEQRAPTLALVDKHKSLVHDRDELAASSQDASRLMMRGQKGEKRDPGKLLREEKMRKRIAKELPKVAAELRKALEKWEDEYGRPFLVHGERYLDCLEAEEPKAGPGPRSRTPGPTPTTSNSANTGLSRAKSVGSVRGPPKSTAKTPTAPSTARSTQQSQGGTLRGAPAGSKGSPTRLPARMPLSNLKHGGNSPDRPQSRTETGGARQVNLVMRAPPPKMRELMPPPELETPVNQYRAAGLGSSIVRQVEPEDVYDDRYSYQENSRPASRDFYSSRSTQASYPQAPPPARQSSHTSSSSNNSTVITGSENWETYDDNSEPEEDLTDAYFAKLRAARAANARPQSQLKRHRGVPPPHGGQPMMDREGNRIVSASEWTDEDGY